MKPNRTKEAAFTVLSTVALDHVLGGVNEGDGAVQSTPLPEGGVEVEWKDPNQGGTPDMVWPSTNGNGGWGIG